MQVRPDKAALIADSLVAANLRGVDSHGVQLLPPYIEAIRRGYIDIHSDGTVAVEAGACMVYDGQNAFGQVVSDHCCRHVVRLARDHGIGVVSARESNHFGAAAHWAQKISAEGMLAMVFCNASPPCGSLAGQGNTTRHQPDLHGRSGSPTRSFSTWPPPPWHSTRSSKPP